MKPTITTGIFHRVPTQIEFDPIDRANSLRRYLNFYDANNRHDVRWFAYSGEQATGSSEYATDDIAALIESGATDGFNPHFRHILGGKSRLGKRCGEANHGGTNSVAFDQYGCDDDTTIHERMHNGLGDGTWVRIGTGLGHSHILRNGRVDNMGDFGSLMGSGTGEGLRAAHRYLLGWFRPEEVIVVSESQQVLIAPVEMDGLVDEVKCVVIRVPGHNDFFLSLHQDWPYNRNDEWDEKLYVHELWPKGHPDIDGDFPNATLLHNGMMPGDGKTLPNGAAVEYMEWEDGIARVQVMMGERT